MRTPLYRCLLVVCVWLCLAASSASAQNWSQFRGQNGAGVADGSAAPLAWDAVKGTNVKWKTPIPGLSHASPIVWGGRVFVVTAISAEKPTVNVKDRGIDSARDDARHTWKLYALDKRSGKILWEQTAFEGVPRARRHLKATQANSTPATDGRVVVALMGSEGLYAWDLTGKLLWKQDLGVLNPGLADDPTSEWGHSSSPIIYRDLVIVQADGHKQSFIAAYEALTGKQRWKVERGELPSWSTPAIYENGGARTELISNAGRFMRGYDPATGKELWRFNDHNREVKMPAPVVAGDQIFMTGGYPAGSPIYSFRPGATGDISLKPGEESNRFLAYRLPRGSSYTSTPLVYGEHLYIIGDNGVLAAYVARTGERVYQERLPSTFSASPVAADGKIYLASEDGDVYVVRAGAKFELLATNPAGEPLMATPAISDGMMYLRTTTALYAICECSPAPAPKGGN
ncbi:MAG TPA: PQQ-binding-like beta-propeller repeat protein [Pyrinomonadaceae bacterium]|nr:PQQ-binding-like beta-propeller repeat protein [Pyrinomonadaceae bacterium]